MNKKRLIITSLLSIFLVTILLIQSTYSIFTTTEIDENSNIYTTGDLNITYKVSTTWIKFTDITPMTEEEADSVIPYRITVTNTGNVPYMFDVILSDTTSSTENTINYQYIMTKVGYLDTKSLSDCTNNIIKENVILPAGESVDIDIRIWLDSTLSNSEIGKSFYAKLTIDGLAVYNVDTENVDNSLLSLRYVDTSSLSTAFKSDTYLTSIKSVSFVDYIDTSNASIVDSSTETASLMDMSFNIMPIENTTEIISWDMSASGDGSIVAWLEDNEEDGYYDLYIGSVHKIYIGTLHGFFTEMTSLESIFFDNLDTSITTNMKNMFSGCSNLVNLDVSNFDTSKVTDMSYMFYNCNSLIELDISNFATRNVTSMYGMFINCSSLAELDVSNFNTSNVINMGNMFYGCGNLTSLEVNNFDTSKVTNMAAMFCRCSSLNSLDLSNFDTSNVTNMIDMFEYCTNLISLDISNFNTSKVTGMSSMFQGCSSLTNLDLSSFDTTNVKSMNNMFAGCGSLTSLDLSSFDTGKVTNMDFMFSTCTNLISLDISNFDTSNVTTMQYMFYKCTKLTTTITIRNSNILYTCMLTYVALEEGSQITLNYTSDTSDLVDSMIDARSSGSYVVKGSLVE